MGRPAVVPPAGRDWGGARPCRGAGEGADREDSFPTGRWRPGWAAKVVGRRA